MPLLLSYIIKTAKVDPEMLLKMINYGVPAAVGAGTTGIALSQKQPIDMSLGYGLGAAMASSPKSWKNLHLAAKSSPDYINTFGRGALKSLMYKAAPVAGVAGLHYVPDSLRHINSISKNVDSSSSNIDSITGTLKDSATNINALTGSLKNTAPDLLTNLNGTAKGMNDFWDPNTGTMKGISTAVDDVGKGVRTLADQSVNVSNLANRGVNMADEIGNRLNSAGEYAGKHKLLLSAILGAGALGTGAYLTRKKKPEVVNNYYGAKSNK